jgi:Zn/Cd-binding protein ZinT
MMDAEQLKKMSLSDLYSMYQYINERIIDQTMKISLINNNPEKETHLLKLLSKDRIKIDALKIEINNRERELFK